MKIELRGILYDLKEGIPITNHNELVNLNNTQKKMISLGDIEKKYVVTPDLSFLKWLFMNHLLRNIIIDILMLQLKSKDILKTL